MNKVQEQVKLDVGLKPISLASTSGTGKYYKLADYRNISFVILAAAIAATKTVVAKVVQAVDEAGTSSKDISSATKTITANTNIIEGTIALASVANTDVVTVNGISFTKAAATAAASREFADAAGLVTCVNDADYGVENVFATVNTTTVTVRSMDGKADITLGKTENAGTITLATTEALATIEVDQDDLDLANSFSHAALTVTTNATIIVAATAVRGNSRREVNQIGETLIA